MRSSSKNPADARRKPLTEAEIRRAFDYELGCKFGPIISPEQLAEIVGVGRSTIYFWLAQGRLGAAIRRRGKHVLIWRDRAVSILFDGPEWPSMPARRDR